MKLRLDQQRFLYRWYEYCPSCGQWRFNEALRGESTGGGKTQFIAAVALLEFAGPDQIAPKSPNIPIAAASFEQANLLFSAVATMCGGRDNMVKESPLVGFFEVYDTEIKFADGRPGRIFRVAAVAGTNEGGLPTLFVRDELHEWGDVGSNKARVATVIGKSTFKRKIPGRGCGRIISLSTAGFDKDHSLLGALYKRGIRALRNPKVAPRLLMDWREAPDGLNYKLAAHRRKAVIAASAAAGVLWNVEDRVNTWGSPEYPPHEWIRYFANKWVDIAEDSWLKDHPQAWPACKGKWTSDPANPFVVVVDMALKHDSVAVSRIEKLPDERCAITTKIFLPKGDRIDHLDVFRHVRSLAVGLGFRGVVYDPRFFELPGRTLEDEGILTIQFDQAQPLDEPVLTPAGWRPIGDLVLGDEVIGADGRATRVVGVHDRGTQPVFEVLFTDGARTRCAGDHLWLTQTPSQRKNGSAGTVRSLDRIRADGLRSKSKASLRFVPIAGAIDYPERRLPLDPYVLGALLGDGSFTERSTPHLTSIDEGIIERVGAGLPDGVALVPRGDGYHYALSSGAGWKPNPVTVALRELGLYGLVGDLKFVPEMYLTASISQRLALLQGLMDTDGTASQGFGASFHTTSPGLRGGLVALVRSLSGIARTSEEPIAGKMRRPAWRTSVGLPPGMNPFGLARKAALVDRRLPPHRAMADIAPLGEMPVRCITVANPDGLYVTKDYVVTHNSPQRMAPACGLAFEMIIGKRIVHDGDPDLADHVQSAVKREQERGFTLSKGKSKKHIDAAITLCMGVWVLHAMEPKSTTVEGRLFGMSPEEREAYEREHERRR